MSGGLFGIAGLFPSEYMTAVVSGQALGGIFTALTFILVLAFGAAPNATAFIFFSIGIALILVNIICYAIVEKKEFFRYYVEGGDRFKVVYDDPTHSRTIDRGVPLEPQIRGLRQNLCTCCNHFITLRYNIICLSFCNNTHDIAELWRRQSLERYVLYNMISYTLTLQSISLDASEKGVTTRKSDLRPLTYSISH